MTSDPTPPIELSLSAMHPSLLAGLDVLLRLGLISDAQVRRIGREQLQCPLPVVPLSSRVDHVSLLERDSPPVVASSLLDRERETLPPSPRQLRPLPPGASSDWLLQLLQSLMAELSVLWLLLLGVFMVVVSSGVLAAIQWQQVSVTGQYSILLAYTLAFWGAGMLLRRRPQLRLTSRMVQIATILLIPVNFWMIDEFALWQQDGGKIVVPIATLLLTGLSVPLLRSAPAPAQWAVSPGLGLCSLGLSWLHLVWRWPVGSLITPYLGILGACLSLVVQDREWHRSEPSIPAPELRPDRSRRSLNWLLTPALVAVAGGVLLLLFRALVVHAVPLSDLSLALGLCGWILSWLCRRDESNSGWLWGLGGLVAGRLASLSAATPWQAIAISALALWVLILRYQRHPQVLELGLVLATGLQMLWPMRRLLPEELRQYIVDQGVQWAGSATGMPTALWGVTVFPYVVLILGMATRLRRRQQMPLALAAEQMALGLGTLLTVVSVSNPLTRSLNLSLSAVTLLVGIRSRPQPSRFLGYLTQVTGLAAIATTIHFQWPHLTLSTWAGLLTLAMMGEWVASGWGNWPEPHQHWQQSTWYLGIILANLCYVLLWSQLPNWGWIGLATPVSLAGLGTRSQWRQPRLAAGLSAIAWIAVQPLTWGETIPRLVGLGLAAIVMVLNTARLRTLLSAALTIGFGLSFGWAALWQIAADSISLGLICNGCSIAILLLWILRQRLGQSSTPLRTLYARASDGWAELLCVLTLWGLTGVLLWSYAHATGQISWFRLPDPGMFLLAAMVVTGAIGYRLGQGPLRLGWYGFAWGIEVSLLGVLTLFSRPLTDWAIANLVLGFLWQGGATWQQRQSQSSQRVSWRVIPLLYGVLGWSLGHASWTATTGLYTLGAALVGIGVGRGAGVWQGITYLALGGMTLAAYELLLYQLLQWEGGLLGDGFVILAALGVLFAWGDRLLSPWLWPFLHLRPTALTTIAHLHWMGASGLMVLALGLDLSSTGAILWMIGMGLLAGYALVQGRVQSSWIYAGLVQAKAGLGYGLHLLLPDGMLLAWGGAIAVLLAVALYALPWSAWGWVVRPWQRSASILPGLSVLLTGTQILIPTVLVVAAFYAGLALVERKIRLSYVSVILADWAIWQLFALLNWQGLMGMALLLGGSLLYMSHLDPALHSASDRDQRHHLRLLATGLVSLAALYESDGQFLWGLGAAGLFMLLILVGLLLRVRAYAYVGTGAFILKVLRQLWLFITIYSPLLWAIGIALGLVLIWIAATFEARRNQVVNWLQYWVDQLRAWE